VTKETTIGRTPLKRNRFRYNISNLKKKTRKIMRRSRITVSEDSDVGKNRNAGAKIVSGAAAASIVLVLN
jgi:hypothetical protein